MYMFMVKNIFVASIEQHKREYPFHAQYLQY